MNIKIKKIFLVLIKRISLTLLFVTLFAPLTVSAVSLFKVNQGGTGVGTITGIIQGNGTAPFSTINIGAGLTFTGSTLSSSGVPGGLDTQVQFNDGGFFGGDSGLTFNKTTNALTADTFIGALTGNASTATALAANPADCASNQFAISINASGTLGCASITDADVPNSITIDLATLATTVTVGDAGGDTTTFPMLATDATGSLGVKTDAGLTYQATTNALTATTFVGALTGNASTASDLVCTDCIGPTEITDDYLLNTGDTSTGTLTVDDNDGASNLLFVVGDSNDADSAKIFGNLTVAGDKLFMTTNTSGAILVADGTNFNPKVLQGDVAVSTTGTATIQANAVALGTDTTGNYVATIADAGSTTITVNNSGTENATVTLDAVDLHCTNCIGPTEITDLALGTDTSGNYVQSLSTSVLTGLTGGVAAAEGTTPALALDYSQALSGDVSLASNNAVFGQSGIVFEGTTADNIETFVVVTDPTTSDKTITFPNRSGTLSLSGDVFTGNVTGTLASSGSTALTIANDAVALTTQTTGNYVASANTASGSGLTGGSTGSEGAGLSLSVLLPAATDALSTTTNSGSGLEKLSAGLTLLQGCADAQTLVWDETNDFWKCATPSSGGITIGTTTITSGTPDRILYDSAGKVGEMTTTGTGTVVALATSPSFTTPALGAATYTTLSGGSVTDSGLTATRSTFAGASGILSDDAGYIFTAASDQLTLGESGQDGALKIFSEDGATDHSTIFNPGTQTQDVIYTLPVDDGTSGQQLQTDGGGILSWASAGGTPTVITVATDTSDSTSFPLFVGSTTGDLGPKTNTGLTFDATTATLGTTAMKDTSMTQNSLLWAGTGGLISQNNNFLKWTDSTKVLGIGSGTTTFTNSGASGGIISTMNGGNTFYVPLSGQNLNSGTTASTDIILGNDAATDTSNYVDLGISSSTNADPNFTGFGAGEPYLYSQTHSMDFGTATANANLKFFTGGTLKANQRMAIKDGSTSIGTGTSNYGGYSGYTLTLGSPSNAVPVFEGIRTVTTGGTLSFLFRGGNTSNPALASVEIASGSAATDGQIDFKTSNAGASVASGFTVDSKQRTSVGGVTPSAYMTLSAGTATANFSPLKFTTGTSLATPEAGAMEYDGKVFYSTPVASARGVSPSEMHSIIPSGDFSLSTGTAVQSAFSSTGDVWNLEAATTYEMEGHYFITKTTASITTALAFALGGSASVTSIRYTALASNAAADAVGTPSMTEIDQVASTVVNGGSAAAVDIYFKGIIRMNAAGTVTPQIQFSGAPTSPVMKASSFINFTPIGSNTQNTVGNVN